MTGSLSPTTWSHSHAPLRLGGVKLEGEEARAAHVEPVDVLDVVRLLACSGGAGVFGWW